MSEWLSRGPRDFSPGPHVPGDTTHRSFYDTDGVEWKVWEVKPSFAQAAGSMLHGVVESTLEKGWLCFESDGGEKRRLAPAPPDWQRHSFHHIIELWRSAAPVRKFSP